MGRYCEWNPHLSAAGGHDDMPAVCIKQVAGKDWALCAECANSHYFKFAKPKDFPWPILTSDTSKT